MRKAKIERATTETRISVEIDLDRLGRAEEIGEPAGCLGPGGG